MKSNKAFSDWDNDDNDGYRVVNADPATILKTM